MLLNGLSQRGQSGERSGVEEFAADFDAVGAGLLD